MNFGFHITTIHADEWSPPQKAIIYEHMPGGPRINTKSANEQVLDIELWIRVIKERTKYARHILPFNNTPKLFSIYIFFTVVRMLNHFPVKVRVSAILSPNTIMYGEKLHYKWHLGINIGQYCQVNEHEDPSSSQLHRNKGAIWLGNSGNELGLLKFMSLHSVIRPPKGVGTPSWCLTLSYPEEKS